MADVCEVTGTSVDLMGDVWPDGSFQLQRSGDASFPGQMMFLLGSRNLSSLMQMA